MTEQEKLEYYTSIVPNANQLAIQEMKFYAFVHYTVNTFTGKEWGNGKENPKIFNPKCQDTDQWCQAIKSAGMKGLILTCKHHDGFCLWPTKTTEHCIKNSPYKNGKGDVVKEVSDSCKKYGLKFGVYLSPWDRNSEFYGTEKYNDFYIEQLTELLTNYGDIFALWLDGACAAGADGKPVQEYDFKRIFETAKKLQPGICTAIMGEDVRWVGNESGVCRESEWSVVPAVLSQADKAESQQNDADFKKFQKKAVDYMDHDLGSREAIDGLPLKWYPAEVDMSIRRGWFYHKIQDYINRRSLNKLMQVYYNSVGANGLFLLNIPPTKDGIFSKKDVEVLKEMGEWINKEESLKIDNVNVSDYIQTKRGYEYDITFEKNIIDRLHLEEDTTHSQRVETFELFNVLQDGTEELIYKGTVIGFGRIAIFNPIQSNHIKLVITGCRLDPFMKSFSVCKQGGYIVK